MALIYSSVFRESQNTQPMQITTHVSRTRVKIAQPLSAGSRLLCPSLTPPQFSVLAKSFPVPKGRMATGGGGLRRNWSRMESIQPTCSSKSAKKLLFQGPSGRWRRLSALAMAEGQRCDPLSHHQGYSAFNAPNGCCMR